MWIRSSLFEAVRVHNTGEKKNEIMYVESAVFNEKQISAVLHRLRSSTHSAHHNYYQIRGNQLEYGKVQTQYLQKKKEKKYNGPHSALTDQHP